MLTHFILLLLLLDGINQDVDIVCNEGDEFDETFN